MLIAIIKYFIYVNHDIIGTYNKKVIIVHDKHWLPVDTYTLV